MTYPPSPTRHAEVYELSDQPVAGPSHVRRSSKSRPIRTLTLKSSDTGPDILFSAPRVSGLPSPQTPKRPENGRRRTVSLSIQGSPGGSPRRSAWANFLNEEHADTLGDGHKEEGGGRAGRTEEVQVPDFGHMLGFNPEDEDHYAVARSMQAEWRKRLYLLMEEPRSGREAFFVHIFVTGAILFSVVLTTLSTLPTFHLHPTSIQLLFGLDTTLVVLFTIEYLARSVAHADSWSQYWTWSTSFFPILDLLAILPYYIEVAREEDTSILFRFTILRTFRLLRVFRAFKYQNQMLLTIEVMYVAVQRSKDALGAISFFILLVLVLFSTLIYFAERGTWDANVGAFLDADGDPSLFDSIPQTAWFALVTMSTVGYGDVVPRSFLGKLLTMPLLLFGLLLIALPSFVLGRNFAIVFDAMTTQIAQKQIAESRDSYEAPPSPITPLPPSLNTIAPTPIVPTSDQISSPHLRDIENQSHSEPLSRQRSNNDKSDPDSLPLLATDMNPYDLPAYAESSKQATDRLLVSNPNDLPGSDGMRRGGSSTGSTSSRRAAGKGVRMTDTADEAFFGSANTSQEKKGEGGETRDLTNTKLAKNQLILLEEIGSLRRVIDKQGEMLARLVGMVEQQQAEQKRRAGPEFSETRHNHLHERGIDQQNGFSGKDHFTLGDEEDEKGS